MTPKVSVIVPIYKAEAYLHKCVDSILAQTFHNFEVLLIDDGSPDKSGKICDEYTKKDSRVRVFHKENGGVTSARKYGLDNCNGEWVLLIDSDDYIEANTLELLLSNSLNSDLVIGHYRYVDENNNLIQVVENNFQGNDPIDVLKAVLNNQCAGSLCCRLIKRTLFNNIYFPPRKINMGEDIIVGIQLIYNAKHITLCPFAIYNYVQQNSSITHNLNSQTVKYMPVFIKWVHSYILEKFPTLVIDSSSFCLQQYYTYLTHSGKYSKELFKVISHERAIQNINCKARILFKTYNLFPWLGNLIKNIISFKHLMNL